MPGDDENRVFDVTRPNRSAPSATSRPIIVGHRPMMADPMVRENPLPEPVQPPASAEHTSIPVQEHNPITHGLVIDPEEQMMPAQAPLEEQHPESVAAIQPEMPAVPQTPEIPEVPAQSQPGPQPGIESQPEAVASTPAAANHAIPVPAGFAATDLHLTHVDDLIGQEHKDHHSGHHHQSEQPALPNNMSAPRHKRGLDTNKLMLWLLLLVIVGAALGYFVLTYTSIIK